MKRFQATVTRVKDPFQMMEPDEEDVATPQNKVATIRSGPMTARVDENGWVNIKKQNESVTLTREEAINLCHGFLDHCTRTWGT